MATERPQSVLAKRRRQTRRRDPNAIVSSAALMTGQNPSKAKMETVEWQARAWHYYDTIGEYQFGVGWLANALSRVNLVAAMPPQSQGDEPTPIDVEQDAAMQPYVDLVAEIAGGVTGQGQLLAQSAIQLSVPGLGYILATADAETDSFSKWRVLSNEEAQKGPGRRTISTSPSGNPDPGIQIKNSESGEWEDLGPDDVLVKVWRAHPRRSWEPTSPVRGVLSTLLEIELLSKRVVAESTSRLIGAGLLLMPEEAEFAPGQPGVEETPESNDTADPEPRDQFVETLMRVAAMAIADQDSPAATTPMTVRMPGELIAKVQHLKFWSEFDGAIEALRLAAIRRLALGLDIPPDVLLGLGTANHWSAWQVAEEAITLHVEPLAEVICHALTVGWYKAACAAAGLDPERAIVWYDTTDLTTRPDRSTSAGEAHARNVISDDSYVRELGLEADPPDAVEFRKRALIAVASGAPTLAPGMFALAGVITRDDAMWVTQLAAGAAPGAPGAPGQAPPPDQTPPDQQQPPDRPVPQQPPPNQPPPDNQPPSGQNSVAVLAAAGVVVDRALERAGLRLRSKAGKRRPGGAESVSCDDPRLLHTQISATQHASLEELLEGAWDRVPEITARFGGNAESLTACLDSYTRGLLSVGHAHDFDRLAAAMGVDVDGARLVTSSH